MITPRPTFPHAARAIRARIWQRCKPHLALLLAIAVTLCACLLAASNAKAQEIPDWCLRGIAMVETGTTWRDMGDLHYSDKRIGADGEVGPWQLAPCALKDLGVEHLRSRIHREPILAESMTRAWLLRCYARTGNWFDAVRIYHTGPDGDRRRGIKYAERVLSAGITTN